MSKTFRAKLFGNRLEWEGESPNFGDSPLEVQVTVLEANQPDTARLNRQAISQVLKNLAQLNTLPDITDPVLWQQSIRQDRHLPGRDT